MEISSSSSGSSGEKSFTNADGPQEVTFPIRATSQWKRLLPSGMMHDSNGSSLVASSPKRPRLQQMDLNGSTDLGVYREGRNNALQGASSNRRTPDLPADFLAPLELQRSFPVQTSPLPWMAPVLPFANSLANRNTDRVSRQFWKAGDYESDQVGRKSVGGGMDHVRVHPKFLHSNATSHKWALGAIAELLDNALDEVVNGATYVRLDMTRNPRNGEPMLQIEDDGGGMNPDSMRQCMSLGYSAKSKIANTIGQYGNGFKTSTMRLGADVIVFSRCPARHGCGPTESIGMLSYTFLRDTGQEDIVVPMLDYDIQPFGLRKLIRSNVDDWNKNMETMKRWSPYSSESELLDQFNGMKSQGTKIIVYNLWEDDQGQLELDFDANPYDIQVRGANRDERNISMAERFPNSRHYLTYWHSLRSYASILYLRLPAGFRMFLRGKEVKHHNLIDDLMFTQESTYKPQGSADQVNREVGQMKAVVTVGFVKDAKEHIDVQGFNVYHKNRLIKPFWRIWNSAASRGRGIIGVLEANFVEPAHDKQGFERTIVLARLESRLLEMQKNYWSKNCHKVGYVNHTVNKDKDGKQAYRGPSNVRAERSPEDLPEARAGPSELQIPSSSASVSRSLRSQTPELLRPHLQLGSNQASPVPLALTRSLRSLQSPQLARQESEVHRSTSLDARASPQAAPQKEQSQRRPLQEDLRAPSISTTNSVSPSRGGESRGQVREQPEVRLPAIPFTVPRGIRSQVHERHQGRLLHGTREPATQVPLDLPPVSRSLVQSQILAEPAIQPSTVSRSMVQSQTQPSPSLVQTQTQPESATLPLEGLAATLVSQKQQLLTARICSDLSASVRPMQSDEVDVSDRLQTTPEVARAVPASSELLNEGCQSDIPQARAHSPVGEVETFCTAVANPEVSPRCRGSESAEELGIVSLATHEISQGYLLKESISAVGQVSPNHLTIADTNQISIRQGFELAAEHTLASQSTYKGSNSQSQPSPHESILSSADACLASSATPEGSDVHLGKAQPGLAGEVCPSPVEIPDSSCPLPHAAILPAAEFAPDGALANLLQQMGGSAVRNHSIYAEPLPLQAITEIESLEQIGTTTAELTPTDLASGRGLLHSQTEECPQECPLQNKPGWSTENSLVSLDLTRPISIELNQEPCLADVPSTQFTKTRPLHSQTEPLPAGTCELSGRTSLFETHSVSAGKQLEIDAKIGERQRDAGDSSKETTSLSPSNTSTKVMAAAGDTRTAHTVLDHSPSKISKNSGHQYRDLLPGRKSLEDLGRMFAKKAVETEKNRIGLGVGVTSDTHSKPTEANVSEIEAQEGSSVLTNANLEAQIAEMEQEVRVLQEKLELVILERDGLRQQLENERKEWLLNKGQLRKSLEESLAQVKDLEARNVCLRQAQH